MSKLPLRVWKNPHRLIIYNGKNVVTTLAPSFLIGSSSFLQATSKPIISCMGSKFSRIRPGTYELFALGRFEKSP